MAAASSSDRFPRLDKYELLAEIGHGGMATVYRGRDLRLDREVAVKVIHKHLRENPEVRRRFVAEAKAVAKLRHPGIVDVYDVSDEDDEERYLVVELIRGTTLRKILDEHGSLPVEIGAIVTSMLCDAVQHAHDTGVIHRDIKPENVLVDLPRLDSGGPRTPEAVSDSARAHVRVKLTDFGIAKVLDAQGVTSTGQILGSPAHMAPEQIEGGDVGPATDVFALGVLMYECMVGHLPFVGQNPAQVLRRVLEGSYEPADSERPEVGGRWASILARALAVDPAARLQSAAELAALIAAELAALGIDDPRRCLDDYFAAPGELRERLTGELVARLIARGEPGRKQGDVQGAAADFNRALAFRPDDLAILRRVSSLTAQRMWKQRSARVGLIVLGAAMLGAGSYGVTRVVRPTTAATAAPSAAGPEPSAPIADTAEPPPSSAPPVTSERPIASAAPSTSASTSRAMDMARGKATRRVRLTAIPQGAHLRVDGADFAWFSAGAKELTIGGHTVEGFMPDDNPCCEPVRRTITVIEAPRDNPSAEQPVQVVLLFKDAQISLTGAPAGSLMSCDNGVVVGAGQSVTRTMATLLEQPTCSFKDAQQKVVRRAPITISAGAANPIPW